MTLLTALDQELADPAITVDGATVHLGELRTRADRLAGELIGADAVAIPGAPTLDTVIAVVAAVRAGVAAVPVPIDAGPVERGHILRDSGATLLIGDRIGRRSTSRVCVRLRVEERRPVRRCRGRSPTTPRR